MKINVQEVQHRQEREQSVRLAIKSAMLVLHQDFGFGADRAGRFIQAWAEIINQLKCDGNDMAVLDDALQQIGFDCFEKEKLL